MKYLPSSAAILGLAAIALVTIACKPTTPSATVRPLVLVSNSPLAALVSEIAGPNVEVMTLGPAGGCGHTFQPAEADMVHAARAQAWFCVGLASESAPWAKALREQGVPQIMLTDAHEHGHAHPADHPHEAACACCEGEDHDPHVWMSLVELAEMSEKITERLAIDQPAEAEVIRTRGDAVKSRLLASHAAIKAQLAPLAGSVFLADHPAYGHFAADYDLIQLGLERNGQAPADAELKETMDLARKHAIRVVFAHAAANTTLATQAAKALNARVVIADPSATDVEATLHAMADALTDKAP